MLYFTNWKCFHLFQFCLQITDGLWKGSSAGGCANHPDTYLQNPRYQLVLESPHNNNQLLLDLKGPKQFQMGLDLIPHNSSSNKKRSSGLFRYKDFFVFI